jgi:hypothetical protein
MALPFTQAREMAQTGCISGYDVTPVHFHSHSHWIGLLGAEAEYLGGRCDMPFVILILIPSKQ